MNTLYIRNEGEVKVKVASLTTRLVQQEDEGAKQMKFSSPIR